MIAFRENAGLDKYGLRFVNPDRIKRLAILRQFVAGEADADASMQEGCAARDDAGKARHPVLNFISKVHFVFLSVGWLFTALQKASLLVDGPDDC